MFMSGEELTAEDGVEDDLDEHHHYALHPRPGSTSTATGGIDGKFSSSKRSIIVKDAKVSQ